MAQTRRRPLIAALAAGALLLAACAEDDQRPAPPGGQDATTDGPAGVAWTHLGVVESTLPDRDAAAAVTDDDVWSDVWQEHGFEGSAPSVPFDDEVVLLLGRPDDACPDDLIGLEVVDGQLETEWLSPPGACPQPLILWLHAVQVHRGVLTEPFEYGPDEPFEDELRPVTLELPAYDGEPPPPPEPPAAMDDAELEAVFADHEIDRCGPEHEIGRGGSVDGELSDDPEVAAAQRARAQHGLRSDEATTREVMEHPDRLPEYDFPMLEEEQEASMQASERLERAMQALEADGWDLGHRPPGGSEGRGMVVPMVDRSDGIRAAVVVGPQDEDDVRQLLDTELGAGEVAVIVDERWPPAEVAAAQAAVTELMAADAGPGSITWVSGPPGPVEIGMIDPTREALDAIALSIEPSLVCVSPELSGVQPLPD